MSRVLSFHYTLKNATGQVLDTSRGQDPFPVLEGSRQIIPALEEELFKLGVNDRREIFLTADQAYGPVNERLRITVSRSKLPEGDIEVGTQFKAGKDPRDPVFTVTKIEGDDVSLDGNHPLAGEDLCFDVEIVEIRDATPEEQTHGHAHGPHGHSH